mgnify:CR=1 FL=1
MLVQRKVDDLLRRQPGRMIDAKPQRSRQYAEFKRAISGCPSRSTAKAIEPP